MFYLTTHSTHFLTVIWNGLNTFYLQLYDVRHMVNYHSDSKRGNLQVLFHGQLFSIRSKGGFISTFPQTGQYIPVFATPVAENWLE